MYEQFYQLETPPFENTADPRFFFASEQHREALAAIEYTIRMRKGIVLITGDIGSGKTTVGQTMCERCADRATIVQVLHGHAQGAELLRHVLRSLQVVCEDGDDHAKLLERLESHLQQQFLADRPVVLLVDEAQTLADAALEELRLLTNFDTHTTKLIQLVLVGQPELRDRICSPALTALRQRVVLSKQLRPLDLRDTAAYIQHRLRAAAADKENVQVGFSIEAIHQVYRWTHGVPRLINVVCDNCLLLGFVKESKLITRAMVRRVVDDMMPNFETSGASVATVEPTSPLTPKATVRPRLLLQPRSALRLSGVM
jgi:general secretion pathway protein A